MPYNYDMQKTYILPEELRGELREVWGVAIFGKKENWNFTKIFAHPGSIFIREIQ
jgi:hypothetical protein